MEPATIKFKLFNLIDSVLFKKLEINFVQ